MGTLTKEYIDNHSHSIHNYESFGRLLVDLILKETSNQVPPEGLDKVAFNMDVEVTPFPGNDCIKICLKIGDGNWWCINQANDNLEEQK
ncbi:MAG: hypothetical protein R2831_06200 [Chitinophagaceae bacterium]